jgi:L-alanine-DL-glutamate epimerase-like enolase superfamily enzyme
VLDRSLRVSAFDVPTTSPEADGTLEWSHTVLVTVELRREDVTGFGYTYADVATAHFVREHLAPIALSCDPSAPARAYGAMERAVRNVGRDGVAAAAISAVDMALWDRQAQALRLSLAHVLGGARDAVDAYGSGGFTSYSTAELQAQLAGWRDEGFRFVKMKIGDDPSTVARVKAARQAIGDIQLFVDANGAFTPKRALGVAGAIADCGVTWFEEPVSSDDLDGLRFVRERAPAITAIAAGEYGYRSRYFDRMLGAGAVDVLQADATRCGVTGFLAATALCAARGVPLSAHCAPTVHAHLGCAVSNVVHIEYFHDHSRIERMLFEGFVGARDGVLRPDPSRPGLGVRFKRSDAARFQVFDDDSATGGHR